MKYLSLVGQFFRNCLSSYTLPTLTAIMILYILIVIFAFMKFVRYAYVFLPPPGGTGNPKQSGIVYVFVAKATRTFAFLLALLFGAVILFLLVV